MLTTKQIKNIAKQNGLPIEAVCPECGLIMQKTSDNVGFEDNSLIEIHFICLGCGHEE